MGKRDNSRLLVELSPEVLQEKFLDWQCQSRMNAFRTQGGRPNTSMTPHLLDIKSNEYSQIIVILVENDCEETTRMFEYNFKKTHDPAERYEKINKKEYSVKKLSTENKELYGSVKPTEISKLIKEKNNIEIKPSMIQPVKEIKALGKFKVKISLHSEVDAEINIVVESAETIQ